MSQDIVVKVGADVSDLQKNLSSAVSKIQSLGSDLSAVGRSMATTFGGATLAIGGGLTYAIKQAADFDSQMRKAGAIAGASAKELDAMRDAALDLGAKTSESASSVAVAMTEMAAKGFNANQTIAAMPGIIAAAEASGEDLALSANTVSSALNIWGLEASEASRVADILTVTANESAAGMQDMALALKYAGGPAAALGISLEELSASIGLIVDSGIDGSTAGTALRASLLALNNPAKAQAKIMDNLGFSMIDAKGNAKGLSKMIADLAESTAHMSEADKVATIAKLVGTEAVSGFLALMKAGPDAIDANTEALRNSEGAAKEASDAMKSGIGGALENMIGAFETLSIKIGDQLIPYVKTAAEWLAALADKFSNLSEGTQKFIAVGTAMVGIFTGVIAGIGVLMMAVGSVITGFTAFTGLLGSLAGALGITGGASGLLGAAFGVLTGPIGIITAAIAGIIAVVVLAYKNIDWFREGVNNAWAKVKEATSKAFEAVKKVISTIVSSVVSATKAQLDKFVAFWDENGKAIIDIVKFAFDDIVMKIKLALGIIKGVFEMVWPLISATVRYAWETIKLVVSTAINIVLGVIQTFLKLMQGDWKGAWNTIKEILIAIWDDIGAFLKGISLEQTGKDIINGLIKGIASMGGAILDAAKGLANSIPAAVKSALKIHSPIKKSSPKTKRKANRLKELLVSAKVDSISIKEVYSR